MSKRTVAEVLVDELAEAGVTRLYGLVGDSLNPVSDALRRDGRIRFIHVRHEETAAFAAGAEAQLSEKLAACAGTSGPGHVHLINGLYDANRSYAPVIAIASHIPGSAIGTRYFQETHPDQLFNECSHCNELVSSPSQMPHVLRRAMQTAVSKRGVSVIALPGDVAAMPMNEEPSHGVIPPPPAPAANAHDIQLLADEINSARKATHYCGSGCRKARKEDMALADKIKAPNGHASRGQQWIEPDNPFDVGMTGLIGFGGAYEAMEHCDLLILLGTDMPYSAWYPKKPRIVQLDIRGEHLGGRTRIDLGVVGDVAQTLRALLPFVEPRDDRRHLDEAIANLKKSREHLNAYVEHVSSEGRPHPEHLTSVIDANASDEAVFTVDTGLNDVWAARYITAKVGRNIIGSFNHGSMACALPMSIGAQLLYPERQVIALCGDGGMTMLMGELLTLVQYNLPVKVIVYNNGALGFINLEMRTAGYPEFQTDMKNPDFARMAEVIGMKGFRIEKGADVEPVIKAALATPGPVLVDALTDPAAIPLPPTITAGEAKGLALGLGKLALMGRFSATMDMIKSTSGSSRKIGGGRGTFLEKGPLPSPEPPLSSQDFQFYRIPVPIFPCGAEANVYLIALSFLQFINTTCRSVSTKTSTKLTHKKEPVNLTDQPALFLSYDRNFLRAASPLYKSLRGWRGGVWGGEEEALLQKGSPLPNFAFSLSQLR